MCVDWIAYILLYIDWIDIESECWWIVLKLVELYVIIEKWWIENEYWWCDCYVNWLLRNDELKWMWKTWFGNVIDLCMIVEKLWFRYMLSWGLKSWDMVMMKEWFELLRLWIWKCVELDWINELCELFVFDDNELVV